MHLKTTIFILFFSLLLVTLLIGHRFGATWAGGEGVTENLDVMITEMQGSLEMMHHDDTRVVMADDILMRGEVIQTGDDGYIRFVIGENVLVGMAERTTLTLESITSNNLRILVTRGRIVVEQTGSEPLHIQTNFTDTTLENGAITLVNYDFLETVMIAPYPVAKASVKTSLGSIPLSSALSIHETPEVKIEGTSPTLTLPFYEWYQR
ncbi:TPA: hypothetical protein DEP34_01475 [Candidatus Uhrbacteria bacterium]|uniref:FecR protein domain-containing protein n=2 Tax=Candidatus Uhriibacteriota TaxID=1752732 RepID=A0A0G1Q7Q3_9BACT|nr:MAG: hypothetical protein UX45_C0004G0026 [Candidatus Uhrbacteria bacterium GW2011_GWF2_46_218]KKU41034.1 MAG: hypothetical protein UX57_C0007G0066 [Candidatus Uhrbacteria bacterium GW2011_GWE2_46_68]HBK33720.1 hypothetical protein [Candidatus Uhrbacteria bacterium]HCB19039.1 hypothetical protein [Candidatus Uhrbacteria bacterium]